MDQIELNRIVGNKYCESILLNSILFTIPVAIVKFDHTITEMHTEYAITFITIISTISCQTMTHEHL